MRLPGEVALARKGRRREVATVVRITAAAAIDTPESGVVAVLGIAQPDESDENDDDVSTAVSNNKSCSMVSLSIRSVTTAATAAAVVLVDSVVVVSHAQAF